MRVGFLVERDDVLDDVRVGSPVERLQVIGCHYVDLLLTTCVRIKHNLLRVTRLEQSFHRLHSDTQCRTFC